MRETPRSLHQTLYKGFRDVICLEKADQNSPTVSSSFNNTIEQGTRF